MCISQRARKAPSNCGFLDRLPREIRDQIYRILLTFKRGILPSDNWHWHLKYWGLDMVFPPASIVTPPSESPDSPLAVLRLNNQIHTEAVKVLLEENLIILMTQSPSTDERLRTIAPSLRRLELRGRIWLLDIPRIAKLFRGTEDLLVFRLSVAILCAQRKQKLTTVLQAIDILGEIGAKEALLNCTISDDSTIAPLRDKDQHRLDIRLRRAEKAMEDKYNDSKNRFKELPSLRDTSDISSN